MNIKLIKTEEEYEQALERIDELWGAKPATKRGDDLELLAHLVERYEEQHYSIPRAQPLDVIKYIMSERGLTNKDMASYFGSASRAGEVLRGKRPLTLSAIRALHTHLGISADLLIGEGELPPKEDVDYSKFPLKELKNCLPGLLGSFDPRTEAEEIMRALWDGAGLNAGKPIAAYRSGNSIGAKNDSYAVTAWLCAAAVSAQEKANTAKQYAPAQLPGDFLQRVVRLSIFNDGPVKAVEFLAEYGITLVVTAPFKKSKIDGAVFFLEESPVIAMSLRYDRLDSFWFTLLHELAHLMKKHVQPGEEPLFDDLDLPAIGKIEVEANEAAAEAILPQECKDDPVFGPRASIAQLHALAAKLGVHVALVAGQVRYKTGNYRKFSQLVGHGAVRGLFKEAYVCASKKRS